MAKDSDHNSGNAQGDYPDHEEYADAILDTDEIDRAHCEVTLFEGEDNRDSLEKIDLVVFGEEVLVDPNDGTKRFDIECVESAVELKYIKNKKYLSPESDLFERFEKDIDRLKELSNGIDTYFLVFSNFDLRRRNTGKDASEKLEDSSDDVELSYTHPLTES